MRDAERRRLEQLAGWRPKHGVISAFLDIDPGDRTGRWRVELKDGLSGLVEPDDHDGKLAVRETVRRVLGRFEADTEPPPGRAQVGFVEVARKKGTEDWSSFQIAPRETVVQHGPRPLLCPLIDLLSRGRPHPVVAVSAERVRGWIWSQRRLEEQPGWGAELAIYPGHERKAPAMSDPARGQATSSSGHDQFDQRLEENRKRFLRELAHELSEHAQVRESELIAIGEAPYLDEFASALPAAVQVRRLEGPDVISEKEEAIADRVGPEIERALAERETELTKSTIDAAMARNGNGVVGVNDTLEALAEGRVEHLLIECEGQIPLEELSPLALELIPDGKALDGAELLVELALRTAADVTPVGNGARETLVEHGGVGAQLRY
jgi:hypothetical protein